MKRQSKSQAVVSVVGSSGGVKAYPARRYASGGGYIEGDRGGPEGRTEFL